MQRIVLVALVVGLAACGDPATEDDRGYTKAPLETPGLLIAGEEATAMDALGTPNRPRPPAPARPMMDVEGGDADGGAGMADDGSAGASVTLAAGVTQAQFDRGQSLYTGSGCAACHGPNAQGSQLAPNLTDSEWLHVDGPDVEAVAMVIQTGVAQPVEYPAAMPAMGGANLSEDEVDALAAYVASLASGN